MSPGAKFCFAAYAGEWINQHPRLRPRTADVYRSLIRRHLAPTLGQIPLGQLDTATVREWRAGLLEAGVSATMVAKSYRLLRAILNTAVTEDELIIVNPCRIKGAGEEHATERPVLTLDQLYALVDLMPDRWKAFLLLKTFASLRWGEITALARNDLDLERRVVRIRRQFFRVPGGLQLGPPKSRAGIRMVSFSSRHLARTPAPPGHLLSRRPGRVGVCQRARAAVASRKLQSRSPLAGGARADRRP
jgi:integrase